MRYAFVPPFRRTAACLLLLLVPACAWAQDQEPDAAPAPVLSAPEPAAVPVPPAAPAPVAPGAQAEITGRVAVGLDKVFIKDARGDYYCLAEGPDLSSYAGRNIVAKVLVIRKDEAYRTVRLLHYRLLSPDDDSPGAEGDAPRPGVTGKKKR